MKFEPIDIGYVENTTNGIAHPFPLIRTLPGAKIIRAKVLGPLYLSRYAQLGPEVTVGKYSGMNEHTFIARATMGAFCAIGARSSINPFNHPTNWLSVHEFQYRGDSYDWVDEYKSIDRLTRTKEAAG